MGGTGMRGYVGGVVAVSLVVVSGLVGAAYVLYLRSEPFPPDIARVIPVLWLAGSLGAVVLGVWVLFAGRGLHRLLGLLALVFGAGLVPLAAIYVLGALMGG